MHLSQTIGDGLRRVAVGRVLCIAALIMTAASQAEGSTYPTLEICANSRVFQGACTLTSYSGVPGSTVYLLGEGFGNSSLVDLYFDNFVVAEVVTNPSGGTFAFALQISPTTPLGQHWITAVQQSSDVAAQAPVQIEDNWSAFRYSAVHRADNPYESILNQNTVGDIDVAWSYLTGGAITSSPVQLDTASVTFTLRGPEFIFDYDTYVGSWDNNVYDIDGVAGTLKWRFGTNGFVATTPAVSNGMVYIGSSDSNVYALRAATGAEIWNHTTGSGVFSSPAVANGTVYIGSNDFNLYALNALTGSVVWSFAAANNVATSPAVSDGRVYAASDDQVLHALNASTGVQVWSADLSPALCVVVGVRRPTYVGSAVISSAAVADGIVFVGVGNGVDALNASTGAPIWSSGQLSTATCAPTSSPALANGVIYVGSQDNNLYALNARTGAVLWNYTTGGAIDSSPAVANGVAYVGSGDGYVYALNASTGALLWSFATGAAVESSPTIANGTLYVGSDDNNLYAFNLAGGSQARTGVPKPDPSTLRPNLSLRAPK
jgi:outer membrane protein assembly factor BamB